MSARIQWALALGTVLCIGFAVGMMAMLPEATLVGP